jgi:membrane-associated phospholipid phosphatase
MSDRSLARLVADALEPGNWIIVLVVLLGWHAGGLAGIGWGLVAGLFAAILPALFVRYGVRHWQWTSRRVSRRPERMAALAFTVASHAAGAAALLALRAPRAMTGYVLGMLATSIAVTAISGGWKISVHCTVASATVALLALAYGPAVLPGYALVTLVAWSRVALGDHTTAQVAGGVALGVIAAVLTHLLADRLLLLSAVPGGKGGTSPTSPQ